MAAPAGPQVRNRERGRVREITLTYAFAGPGTLIGRGLLAHGRALLDAQDRMPLPLRHGGARSDGDGVAHLWKGTQAEPTRDNRMLQKGSL